MQTRNNQEELVSFLDLIPPGKQLKVLNEYFKKRIMLNPKIIKLIDINCRQYTTQINPKNKRNKKLRNLKSRNKLERPPPGVLAEQEKQAILNSIVNYMASEFMQPEEDIIKEGYTSDKFYFVI